MTTPVTVERMARSPYDEMVEFRKELDRRAETLRRLRAEADEYEAEFRRWAIGEWKAGRAAGVTAADIAAALGITRQRVYQLSKDIEPD